MKKISVFILLLITMITLCACDISQDSNKAESDALDGILINITKIEHGTHCDGYKSKNGEFVKVYFTAENVSDHMTTLYESDFKMNDTYTMRKPYEYSNNFTTGYLEMLGDIKYECYLVFDCVKYNQEANFKLIWNPGIFSTKTKIWEI